MLAQQTMSDRNDSGISDRENKGAEETSIPLFKNDYYSMECNEKNLSYFTFHRYEV